jgi:hypothetical protein
VITDGTKRWAKIKKQEERDYLAAERAKERFQKGQKETVFITDVIGEIIPGAYADAAGKSGMAQCRQIYYSARGPVFQMTGKELDYPRFRNKLLPEFMRDNKKLCADWDVIFEGRGHFIEPHTDYRFEIGTLGVRQYLQDIKTGEHGPRHLYDAILYIEKEGFLPILKHDGILERYDMAVMSSKGQNSTSLRELVDSLNGKVKILAVHDFDIAGFSIVGTLTLDTERWHHQSDVKVIDLGLRLEDIDGLQTETVDLKGSDPTGRLEKNGATEEEIEFLCSGRRVELNAFPSDDFIAWLDRKLNKHKVKKIIPDDKTLGGVYRAVIADQRLQDVIKAEKKRIYEEVRKIDIPRNLGKRVAKRLKIHPAQRWNVALAIEASENSKQDRQ